MKANVSSVVCAVIVATFVVTSSFAALSSMQEDTTRLEKVGALSTNQAGSLAPLKAADSTPATDTYLNKISPGLRGRLQTSPREATKVVVYTSDPEALGLTLRTNGVQTQIGTSPSNWLGIRPIVIELPAILVAKIAYLESVAAISTYSIPEPPQTLDPRQEGHATPQASGGDPPEPNTLLATKGHKASDAWALGYTGQDVKVAIMDSGVDFAHPDLLDTWAVDENIASPYYNWPIAFDPNSMYYYAIFGLTFPAMDSWYIDTSFNATPFANQTLPSFNGRWYNVSGISSASGWYHLGLHPAQTLQVRFNHSPAVLVADSVSSYIYDTIYIDLNDNGRFDDDKPTNISSPISYADYRNATDGSYSTTSWNWGDGMPDMSGGLVYFIADGNTPVPYSDIIATRYGLSTQIPGNGNLVALMIGDQYTAGGDHGTLCASAVVAQNRTGYVQGFAPGAKVIPVGNIYLGGFWMDIYPFAIEGYDGTPDTGDEAMIGSSSYGSSAVDNDGWDIESRWLSFLTSFNTGTTFVIATGNGGPGFGTVVSPGGSAGSVVSVGASTNYYPNPKMFWEASNLWTFGDVQPWSNRGPSAIGNVAPHVVTVGAWASGSLAINRENVASTNGTDSWDIWGGTSLATPATAGIVALIYDAYNQANSAYPTSSLARGYLMNGADNIHYDSLIMGAGLSNALNSALLAANEDGVSVDPPHWTPGDYNGTAYPFFAQTVNAGDSVQQTFQLENMNTTTAATANITDAVLTKTGQWTTDFWSTTSAESPWSITRPDYLWNVSPMIPPNTHLVRAIMYTDFTSFDVDSDYNVDSHYWIAFYNWKDFNSNGSYWNDSNGNGVVNDGEIESDEYVRFTFAYGLTNVQNAFVHDPLSRVDDALLVGVSHYIRSPMAPNTQVHIVLEFYELTDSTWLSESTGQVVLSAGGTNTFDATLNVPSNTSVGVYSNMLIVTVNGEDTVIPVVINVAGADEHITFDEDLSDTSYYDNGRMYVGPDWSWRPESGDWRFYYTDIPDNATITAGTRFVVHTSWTNMPTDIDTIILGPTEDYFSNDPLNLVSLFGPYTLDTIGRSADTHVFGGLWTFDTATGGPDEWVSAPAKPGLHEIALHNVINAGMGPEETFSGETGLITVDPCPWSERISTNTGTKSFNFISTLALPQGLEVKAYGLSQPTTYTSPITQDESRYFFENISNVGMMDIVLSSIFAVDIDLIVYYWVAGTGYVPIAASLTPTADEQVKLIMPADGSYLIEVYGYYVPMPGVTFDLLIDKREGTGLVPTNVPVGAILPNVPYQFDIDYTTLDVEGDYYGIIFVGPLGAPTAIEIPVMLEARDTTPPALILNSPTPDGGYRTSTVPSIDVSIDDVHGAFYSGIDLGSVKLFVDGHDVTSSASIVPGQLWWNLTFLLGEGLHTANITARDMASSPNSAGLTFMFTIDDTAPTIVLTSPTVSITNQLTVNVSGYTESNITTVLINGQPTPTTNGAFYRFVSLTVGVNTISIEATDTVGNTGYLYKTITLDQNPPTIIVSQPLNGSYLNDDSVEVIGTTEPGVALTINGFNVAVSPVGAFAIRLALIEGQNTITVTAVDPAGNQAIETIIVIVDTVPPSLTLTSPSSEYSMSRTVRVEGQTEAGASVTVDGLAPDLLRPDGYFLTNITYISDGSWTITVAATDIAGNIATVLVSITVDTVAPNLTVTKPTQGLVVMTPAVEVEGSTEVGATVTVSGQSVAVDQSGAFATTIPLPSPGLNTIVVVSQDPAGNINSVQITVDYDAPNIKGMEDEIQNLTILVNQLTQIMNDLWHQLNMSNDNASSLQERFDRLYENFTGMQNDLATLRANIDSLSNVLLMAIILLIVMLFVGIIGLYFSLGRKIDSLRGVTEEELEVFEEEEKEPEKKEEKPEKKVEKPEKPKPAEKEEIEEIFEEDLEDDEL